jgi:hypothetical protein
MTIQGPAWLSSNEKRSVTANSLKSNVLCKKHNSELSDVDATGVQFCNYLRNIKSRQNNLTLDYNAVERWMLKLLCGFGASGYIKGLAKWLPSREWLDILFLSKNLPDGIGLYYLLSNKRLTGSSDELGVWPITTDDLQTLIGFHFLLAGYMFLFAMTGISHRFLEKYTLNNIRPIYRPDVIQIKYRNNINELHLKTNTGEIVTVNITNT